MAVPYTFATATSAIPLSQLDSNFATAITLGSTALTLGTTTTTVAGLTLTSPTLTTPALGTPSSGVLTNCTGYPGSAISGTISLTTQVTGTLPVANGGTGVTTSTGTGSVVLSTSPTLVTPVLGTPTSGTLTNCTGLPNAGLVNSTITIGGTSIALGGSSSAITNDITIHGVTVGQGAGSVSSNTAVGTSALTSNTTGASNQAFGSGALSSNTTGNYNSAFAQQSLGSNSTGSSNTSVGYQSLVNNTTASSNTAVGYQAGYANTTGANSVFIGNQAGTATTTASFITAVGNRAAYSNTTGTDNTAVGAVALNANTTGGYNIALGNYALFSNTTASNNTAVGYQAGYGANGTNYSIFIGPLSGYGVSGAITGAGNTVIGPSAGASLTSGAYNTFVGPNGQVNQGTGGLITSGSKNTIIGGYNGNQGGLDIRTSSNYIVLSDGDGNPRAYWNNNGQMYSTANASNDIIVDFINSSSSNCYGVRSRYSNVSPNTNSYYFYRGQDSTATRFDVYSNGGIANYSANNVNLSDKTLKKDISLAKDYLAILNQIPVKTFLYNDQTDTDLNLGVIAQEVQAVAPELVGTMNIGSEETPNIKLAIYETDLKYAMLKAIQELSAKVTALEAKLGA